MAILAAMCMICSLASCSGTREEKASARQPDALPVYREMWATDINGVNRLQSRTIVDYVQVPPAPEGSEIQVESPPPLAVNTTQRN